MAKTEILDEAITHLEHATRLSPRNARYHALLGEGYLLRGDIDDAVAPLQMSYQQEAHPRTAYLLAVTLLRTGNHRDSERYADVALEEGNAFHRSYHVRSRARLGLGDREGAINDLWYALDLVPGDETYRLELARLLVERAFAAAPGDRRRRLVEARDVLLLRDATPEHEPEWRYLAGCSLLELGEVAAALDHLERTEFPSVPEVAFRRGVALMALGRKDEARAFLEEARADASLASEVDRQLGIIESQDANAHDEATPQAPRGDTTLFVEIGFDHTGPRVESGPVVPSTIGEALWAEEGDETDEVESAPQIPEATDQNPADARTRLLPVEDPDAETDDLERVAAEAPTRPPPARAPETKDDSEQPAPVAAEPRSVVESDAFDLDHRTPGNLPRGSELRPAPTESERLREDLTTSPETFIDPVEDVTDEDDVTDEENVTEEEDER